MTGIPLLYAAERSPCDVCIQVEGEGQCIDAKDFCEAIEKCPSLLRTLLRFAHVFNVQCLANSQCKLEERLARWLLMAQDRLDGGEMLLTHEFLALMLGVRRAGVSVALQHFENKKRDDTFRCERGSRNGSTCRAKARRSRLIQAEGPRQFRHPGVATARS